MNKKLDSLLTQDLLSVPSDFTECVMNEINQLPVPRQIWQKRFQWFAIIGSAVLGFIELFSFIFGMWIATTAY